MVILTALTAPTLAGLLEDVDKLTPQEASLFQEKLSKKAAENIPLESAGTFNVQFINPSAFNAAFPGVAPMTNLYGGSFTIRKPINDRFLIGGNFGGGANFHWNESASKVFEDAFLGYGSAQFVTELRLVRTENFILATTLGAGVMLGGYNYSKTDDNLKTSYSSNRWGTGFCESAAIDAYWSAKDDWGFGIGAGYFSGKLGNMRVLLNSVDGTAPEIDLSGMTFRISGTKSF